LKKEEGFLKRAAGKFSKYFKDVKNELKRVIWPTRSQLINNTITVLILCFIVGVLIWLFDWDLAHCPALFTKLMHKAARVIKL